MNSIFKKNEDDLTCFDKRKMSSKMETTSESQIKTTSTFIEPNFVLENTTKLAI